MTATITTSLTAFLILLIVSNNISLLTDYLKIAGVSTRKTGRFIIAVSMSLGFILEGAKMTTFVESFNIDAEISFITLLILITLFLLGNFIKLPTSATLSTVGVLVGVNIFFNIPTDVTMLYNTIILWILSPILSIILAYILYLVLTRRNYSIETTKAISIFSTAFLGYVFGVNTLGLLASLGIRLEIIDIIIYVTAIFVGSIFLSAKLGEEIGRTFHSYTIKTFAAISLSTSIIIEVASNLSIPVPLTSLIILSLFGPILAKETRIINLRIFKKVFLFWILTPIVSLVMSIAILFFIHRFFF